MKRMTGLLSTAGLGAITIALAGSAWGGDHDAKATIGEPAPDFTLTDSSGTARSLSSYAGKIVVLEWVNPDCPWVQKCYDAKATVQAYEQIKTLSKDAVWLAINTTYYTVPAQNNAWIEKYKLDYPILLDTDGEVGMLYGARRTPHVFVIDKKGVLRYQGALDDNKMRDKPAEETTNYAVNAVRQILEGETVAPDKTKPYGCSVKYPKKK